MDKTFRNILIVIAVIVVGAALFYGGMIYSRMNTWYGGYDGMMGNGSVPYQSNNDQRGYYGPGGMMNGNGYSGMMNGGGYGGMMGGDSASQAISLKLDEVTDEYIERT